MVSFFRRLFGRKKVEVDAVVDVFAERHKFVEEQQLLSTPWAMFEVVGFQNDGQIKVEFNWNQAFIRKLDQLGFTAETEQDTVQLFFYASQMRPTHLVASGGDENVQAQDLPLLSPNSNRFASGDPDQ